MWLLMYMHVSCTIRGQHTQTRQIYTQRTEGTMLINIDGTVLSYIQCSVEVLSADLVQDGKVHSLYQL